MSVNETEDASITAALTGYFIRKFGLNDAVTHFDDSIVWPEDTPTYPFQTSAQTITIESDDASDAGIEFNICGLDNDGLYQEEAITIGASATTMVSKFLRICRAYVTGSTINAGYISIKAGSDVLAVIQEGEGQTQQMIYTVPADKKLILSQFIFSTSINKDAEFRVWQRNEGSAFVLKSNMFIQNASTVVPYIPHDNLPPMTDIYISVHSSIKGRVTAQMFGYLYPKDYGVVRHN